MELAATRLTPLHGLVRSMFSELDAKSVYRAMLSFGIWEYLKGKCPHKAPFEGAEEHLRSLHRLRGGKHLWQRKAQPVPARSARRPSPATARPIPSGKPATQPALILVPANKSSAASAARRRRRLPRNSRLSLPRLMPVHTPPPTK